MAEPWDRTRRSRGKTYIRVYVPEDLCCPPSPTSESETKPTAKPAPRWPAAENGHQLSVYAMCTTCEHWNAQRSTGTYITVSFLVLLR